MSYMRGRHYVWSDGSSIHVWSATGYDEWDASVWNEGVVEGFGEAGRASGVALPLPVFDAIVVMRLAELVAAGSLDQTIDRAVARYGGNGGCMDLVSLAAQLKASSWTPGA